MPLSKRSDLAVSEKVDSTPHEHSPPPAYVVNADPPDITAGFADLNLSDQEASVPTPDQCIAHLKLLEAFHQLREDVALEDGKYGIKDDFVNLLPASADERDRAKALTQIREKRWAVFVTKATYRFERWWTTRVQRGAKSPKMEDLETFLAESPLVGDTLDMIETNLPPLGASGL